MRRPNRLLVATLLALAALYAPSLLHAAPAPVVLRLSAPVAVTVGDSTLLEATLTSEAGEPIEGALVTLYERAAFFDLSTREIVVASAITNDEGRANLHFDARRTGARDLVARFARDEAYAAAEARIELAVREGAQVYAVESQPGIPGVNRFLLIAILSAVWGTMLIVALHVVAIAREGDEGAAGA